MDNSSEAPEKSLLPVSAIDGAKIKSLRETKKLTQLYVASVVGVTTDTISRWENNRYPTIKRDNAEKLASALEVELADILRQDEKTEDAAELPEPARHSGSRSRFMIAFLAVLSVLAAFVLFRALADAPAAERRLPTFAAPGEVIPVQVRISRKDSSNNGFIVKERLPSGWRLVRSLPPAAGQAGADEVKWLVPPGSGMVTISYTVSVPPTAGIGAKAAFSGEIVSRTGGITRNTEPAGDRMLTVAGIHWADRNGDSRIDDEEIMPAYYLSDEMKGLDLNWTIIEAIWSGKGYRWDSATRKFQVIK